MDKEFVEKLESVSEWVERDEKRDQDVRKGNAV